jgi:hypothetical protein
VCPRRPSTQRIIVALLFAALGGCAVTAQEGARQYLDETTGDTVLAVAAPIVLARERTDVAAHARDYATLVAVAVDRSGRYEQYLLVYRWSTVDRRMSPPPAAAAGALRLLADGRQIDLAPEARLPVDLGRRVNLRVPAHADLVARAYAVDPATLQFIAASRELRLVMPQETLGVPFTLWEDGRGALARYLGHISGP